MSNKPTGERIRSIDRLVVINDYRRASDNIRFTRAADVISPQLPASGSSITIYVADDIERLLLDADCSGPAPGYPQGYEQNFRNAALVQSVTRGGKD